MSNISVIIFFIVTASLGIALLLRVLKDLRRPIFLVVAHGILGSASYGLFCYYIADKARTTSNPYGAESYAFVLISFAIVIGILMLIRDKILKIGLKKWMPFVHAGLAATGLVIFIIATIIKYMK